RSAEIHMYGLIPARFPRLLLTLCCVLSPTAAGSASSPSASISSRTAVMDAGRAYGAGTRVHIPKGDASFVIPPGWHAQLPEDSDAIIAVSESGAGFVMVFMVLNL